MKHGTAKDVGAIVSSAGDLVGRTRLQKTVALLEMVGLGYGFTYDYYKFGPYSEELSNAVDRAVALGYVQEQERRANWGGVYSIFKAKEKRATGVEARDQLIEISRNANAVELELAVTAGFLALQGVGDAWAEVSRRKPEKVGDLNLAKAKALYQRMSGVPDVPNPLPKIA